MNKLGFSPRAFPLSIGLFGAWTDLQLAGTPRFSPIVPITQSAPDICGRSNLFHLLTNMFSSFFGFEGNPSLRNIFVCISRNRKKWTISARSDVSHGRPRPGRSAGVESARRLQATGWAFHGCCWETFYIIACWGLVVEPPT